MRGWEQTDKMEDGLDSEIVLYNRPMPVQFRRVGRIAPSYTVIPHPSTRQVAQIYHKIPGRFKDRHCTTSNLVQYRA